MPQFKDFNKDVKDLLSKNYSDNGAWKIESKFKGPEQTVFVNPGASLGKGGYEVTVDVEYNQKPFKTKATLDDKGGITAKGTWEEKSNKVEVTVKKSLEYEVVYEGKFGDLTVKDIVNNKVADASASYVVPGGLGVSVGAGLVLALDKFNLKHWSAGVHYNKHGVQANIVTTALETYNSGVQFDVNGIPGPVPKMTVAAQTLCGHGKGLGWGVGTEFGCPIVAGAKVRVKFEGHNPQVAEFKLQKISVAWYKKLSDNWKVAIGAELLSKKVGLTFTRE